VIRRTLGPLTPLLSVIPPSSPMHRGGARMRRRPAPKPAKSVTVEWPRSKARS
jgi:hypothetical protein